MRTLPSSVRISLACEPIDFRNANHGLVGVVGDHLGGGPFDGSVFLFLSKRRDRIKLLLWDRDGFCLLYNRWRPRSCTTSSVHGTPAAAAAMVR